MRFRDAIYGVVVVWAAGFAGSGRLARAADALQAAMLFRTGEYAACIAECAPLIAAPQGGENLFLLKADAEQTVGRYAAAQETLEAGLRRFPWSLRLRLMLAAVSPFAGQPEKRTEYVQAAKDLVSRTPWRYADGENLVGVAELLQTLGADPKDVFNGPLEQASRLRPLDSLPTIAKGELALNKRDWTTAARFFELLMKAHADDPRVRFGLARSWEHSRPQESFQSVQAALQINPHYVPALRYRAELAIVAEKYDVAAEQVEQMLAVHAEHPAAWALEAVLAWLQGDAAEFEAHRRRALAAWPQNPEVDYLIGKLLSQRYFFAEGAARQRQALAFDAAYGPAQHQLASDLLRLGEEDEGARLIRSLKSSDPYDVTTFNLAKLLDRLEAYETLEDEHFVVRMSRDEAPIYGALLLKTLNDARQALDAKYGATIEGKTLVEVFDRADDFAVRTFGLPGAGGYLGVCFGRVITMNGPAAVERPVNWRSVLWHEYCHVVTLQRTRHRIPRWLSEGISVYEERLAHPTWGERMTPQYRQWILAGRLKPVQEMSAAFLQAESPAQLQFAYFQASLVVEFLQQRQGAVVVPNLLEELSRGISLDDAMQRHVGEWPQLEAEFREFALEATRRFAPLVDWTQPDLSTLIDSDDSLAVENWCREHPGNLHGWMTLARQQLIRAEPALAIAAYEKAIELAPQMTGAESAYVALAALHRERNDAEAERDVLRRMMAHASDAQGALERLLELELLLKDLAAGEVAAERLMSVNPLLPALHRSQALLDEAGGRPVAAIRAWRAHLKLAPNSPVDARYRLARLLHGQGDPSAKRELLQALEMAPRYRDAHRLLLEIVGDEPQKVP